MIEEQEDMFFARHVAANPAMRLATREIAADFCLEVPCDDLASSSAMGTVNNGNSRDGGARIGVSRDNQAPVSSALMAIARSCTRGRRRR